MPIKMMMLRPKRQVIVDLPVSQRHKRANLMLKVKRNPWQVKVACLRQRCEARVSKAEVLVFQKRQPQLYRNDKKKKVNHFT